MQKKGENRLVQRSLSLTKEQSEWLDRMAQRTGKSVSHIIRGVMVEHQIFGNMIKDKKYADFEREFFKQFVKWQNNNPLLATDEVGNDIWTAISDEFSNGWFIAVKDPISEDHNIKKFSEESEEIKDKTEDLDE